ncbi:MAG: hypothetical protein SGCHY_001428 [Lobulomycetales sp.]
MESEDKRPDKASETESLLLKMARLSTSSKVASQTIHQVLADLEILRGTAPALSQSSAAASEAARRTEELDSEVLLLTQIIKQYEHTLAIVMKRLHEQVAENSRVRREAELAQTDAVERERQRNEALQRENSILQARLDECLDTMRQAVASSGIDDQELREIVEENQALAIRVRELEERA